MDDDAMILAAAVEALSAASGRYARYHRYYDGEHALAFATRKFTSTFGDLFRAFADNLCATVVDATADRLTIESFAVEGAADGAGDAATDAAMLLWRANRMDRRQGEVHGEALTAGDSYLIVWPDEANRPVFFPNRAATLTVHYDPESPGTITWAARWWVLDDGRMRLTLYYPDRIVKYVTRQSIKSGALPKKLDSFEPFRVEREAWPLPNPWDIVPVFHFANNAGVGEFGRSELRDVLPLQDALNKSIADMMVAMEIMALPQRIITGWEPEINPETGKPRSLPSILETWTAFASSEVGVSQLMGADLSQFHATQESFRKEIATVSRTPLHYITPPTGEFPSGESLKTAESAFTKKVRDRQTAFGNVWEDAMRLALRMAGGPDVALNCVWADPEARSDKERDERVQLHVQSGASYEGALRLVGYSDDDVQKAIAVSLDGLRP